MSTHCLEETVPGTEISYEREGGSNRTKQRPGTKSCCSQENGGKEGGAKLTKLKTKGRVLLPSLPNRNPTQDIVLALGLGASPQNLSGSQGQVGLERQATLSSGFYSTSLLSPPPLQAWPCELHPFCHTQIEQLPRNPMVTLRYPEALVGWHLPQGPTVSSMHARPSPSAFTAKTQLSRKCRGAGRGWGEEGSRRGRSGLPLQTRLSEPRK